MELPFYRSAIDRGTSPKKRKRDKRWKPLVETKRLSRKQRQLKKSLLKTLSRQCFEMADPITLNEFHELSIGELQQVQPLGKFVNGKQRCYQRSSLQHLKDTKALDPVTRSVYTPEDWEKVQIKPLKNKTKNWEHLLQSNQTLADVLNQFQGNVQKVHIDDLLDSLQDMLASYEVQAESLRNGWSLQISGLHTASKANEMAQYIQRHLDHQFGPITKTSTKCNSKHCKIFVTFDEVFVHR